MELGWTQRDIVKAKAISQQALSVLIKRDSRRSEYTTAIAKVLGLSAEQLTSGKWPKSEERSLQYKLAQSGLRYSAEENTPSPQQEIVDVPVFDVDASMGFGEPMPEQDTVIDKLRLTRTWISRHLPVTSAVNNLAVITAYGDSMSPAFNDGDILLVDRGVMTLALDAVYVIDFDGELYIKRLQRRGRETVSIISDNTVYPPIVLEGEDRGRLRVLGRVLWAWNGRKY